MKLYIDPIATTCRSIMLFAIDEELALDVVNLSVLNGEHRAPWFAAINAEQQVPVLQHGDFTLTESTAILRYLAEQAASPALPADPQARARVDEALSWFNSSFLRDFAFGFVYPQVLPDWHGFGDPAVQCAIVARGEERTGQLFAVLERRLAASRGAFLLGPQICIADYFGASAVKLAELVDYPLDPFPHVTGWMSAMQRRPGWEEAFAAFYGWKSAIQATRKLMA